MSLVVGVALALGCLAYVIYPIFRVRRRQPGSAPAPVAPAGATPLRDVTDEEIEAAVQSYRVAHAATPVCPACGPRPESDALFCSSCGRQLG